MRAHLLRGEAVRAVLSLQKNIRAGDAGHREREVERHRLRDVGALQRLFVEPARRVFGAAASDAREGRRYDNEVRRSGVSSAREVGEEKRRWVRRLDALVVVAFAVSLLAVGFDDTDKFGGLFRYVTSERALSLFTAALVARLCLAYPTFLRAGNANFVETLRSDRRDDLFWLSLMLSVVGFCYSLGWNFFFYRICYDLLPVFRSMRVPTRGSMFAYLGLALLAGAGVRRLAALISERRSRIKPAAVYAAACALLLIELNGAPLDFMRGAVFHGGDADLAGYAMAQSIH